MSSAKHPFTLPAASPAKAQPVLPAPAAAAQSDFEVTADSAPIPAGEYILALSRWETCLMFGKCAKVALWFKVLAGPHAGAMVARFYNAERLIPPMGDGGRFQVRRGGDFTREFGVISAALGIEGASLAALRGVPVRGLVRTVDKTRNGETINTAMGYSVVAKLTGIYK